tara:strand:- start:1015 stop:1992 length:978 start_codon:yes stop_codon:yes gene_type:complete
MSRIRADKLVNRAGSGGPHLPNGVASGFSVTGVVTATSFSGDGSQLSGISADSSSLVDSNSATRVQATTSGATITGDTTISGNLNVNGTTTTIDTAVTSVDSLAVDGQITSGTRIGIGTTTPHVYSAAYGSLDINGTTGGVIDFRSDGNTVGRVTASGGTTALIGFGSGDLTLGVAGGTHIRIHGDNRQVEFLTSLSEKCIHDSTGLTGDKTINLLQSGNVYLNHTNAAGPFTINLRGDETYTLSSMIGPETSLSYMMTTAVNNSSNYMTAFKIDGTTLTPGSNIFWAGGSAPSAAGTSGYDVYTFTIYKYNNNFQVFASLTNHA